MIAPISIQVMENFGLPSARARLLIPLLTIRNGIPIAVIRVYSLAYGMISAVGTECGEQRNEKNLDQYGVDHTKDKLIVNAVPTTCAASYFSPAP